MEAGSKNRFTSFGTTRQIHTCVIQKKTILHSHRSPENLRRPQESTAELNITRDAKFYVKLAARGKANVISVWSLIDSLLGKEA